MEDVITLNAFGEKYSVVMGKGMYLNKRLAISFYDPETAEVFGILSVNIPEAPEPPRNHFWAKTWSENEPWASQLLDLGICEDTGQRYPTGYVTAQLWKLTERR